MNSGERIVHMVCRWAMAMLFIACVWQALEFTFYGAIQPRTVDSIMWGLWGITLIFAYREGKA